MQTFHRITFDPQIMGGPACIRGMRITAARIIRLIANGMTRDEIVAEYPDLAPEDIQAALSSALAFCNALQPVGRKRPNPRGLRDMAGLVWEWCWDRFGAYPDTAEPLQDPSSPDEGDGRAVRGGSFVLPPVLLRSAFGGFVSPVLRGDFLGLWCVRSGARQP
jgi:uncharacterized protein (DUF433 family)